MQSNYVLVFLVLVLYCLISSPLLLIVIAGAGGAAYFASVKNETRKIAIAGTKPTKCPAKAKGFDTPQRRA